MDMWVIGSCCGFLELSFQLKFCSGIFVTVHCTFSCTSLSYTAVELASFFPSLFFSSFYPVFCVPVRLDNVLQLKLMFALILVPSSNWPSHSWLNCICLGWQLCFWISRFSGINGIVWIGRLITYWLDWPSNCESVCCISGGTAHIAHYWMIHASNSRVQVKAVMYTAWSLVLFRMYQTFPQESQSELLRDHNIFTFSLLPLPSPLLLICPLPS